jgi:hypothetical protein
MNVSVLFFLIVKSIMAANLPVAGTVPTRSEGHLQSTCKLGRGDLPTISTPIRAIIYP